jgi:hypothetical protein
MVPTCGIAAGSTANVRLTPSAFGLLHSSAAAGPLAATDKAMASSARALKLRIHLPCMSAITYAANPRSD